MFKPAKKMVKTNKTGKLTESFSSLIIEKKEKIIRAAKGIVFVCREPFLSIDDDKLPKLVIEEAVISKKREF